MFYVHNKPILEHLIQIFKNAESLNFICVVRHQAHLIRNYFRDGTQFGIEIRYVEQEAGKGNAYAVRSASSCLGTGPFFYCDADILFHRDLAIILLDRVRQVNPDAVFAFGKDPSIAPTHRSAQSFSNVLTATAERLGVPLGQYVLMGVNIFGPVVLDAITSQLPPQSDREVSVSEILLSNLDSINVEPAFYEGPWWHLACPDDFPKLQPILPELKLQ